MMDRRSLAPYRPTEQANMHFGGSSLPNARVYGRPASDAASTLASGLYEEGDGRIRCVLFSMQSYRLHPN